MNLPVWSAAYLSFNELVKGILTGQITLLVCQGCGFIVASEEHATPTDKPGERVCPECKGEMVQATPDTLNEAFDCHYPWRRCDHCGCYFLFDEDISKIIEPDPNKYKPGQMGCPYCHKMTD